MVRLTPPKRHKTHQVTVGTIKVGGNAPIVVQSMTNTDTADLNKTVSQIKELYHAGSEIIRLTVNNDAAAKNIENIKNKLISENINVPLVGCFHYNGHKLLTDYPSCAQALDKYRINPGNVGFGKKKDKQFEMMVEAAISNNKPIRIGVNWGSLDQDLSAQLMDKNAKLLKPLPSDAVLREALIQSALSSAEQAEKIGLTADKIIISCKVSRTLDLIAVYKELAKRSNYALHLGLTEAGMGSKGIIATTSALSTLLLDGIGDTIRASLTPQPGENRSVEVTTCQEILQSLNLRFFTPQVSACPGCGRTTSTYFQELADKIQTYLKESMPQWKMTYPGVETLNVAVMGCIVNGPGESKHADIGISLPGTGESPIAPVFIDGRKAMTLRGDHIAEEFMSILNSYIDTRFKLKKIA